MSKRPSSPRGMRDFLPNQVQHRKEIAQHILSVYEAHGFSQVETPALEDLAFLESGQGGDNEKLIFRTMRRALELEEIKACENPKNLADFGLRYDLTVPLSRYYATNQPLLPSPFRAIQMGPVWRAERPQKGRFRQFVQCDIDIIGEAHYSAEVALISATLDALTAVGLDRFTIRLNDRRILTGLLKACGFDQADWNMVLIIVDKLDKIEITGVKQELEEKQYAQASIDMLVQTLQQAQAQAQNDFLAIAAALPSTMDQAVIQNLIKIAQAVKAQANGDISLHFDLTLVRGMGYYTGPIMEISHPDMPGSIAGGGRYDEMIGRFINEKIPACGFSIGFERLCGILGEDGKGKERLALMFKEEDDLGEVMKEARGLRTAGWRVETYLLPNKVKGLMKKLSQNGFSHCKRALSDKDIEAVIDQEL
jgi:histidyl-tRNA synthetase